MVVGVVEIHICCDVGFAGVCCSTVHTSCSPTCAHSRFWPLALIRISPVWFGHSCPMRGVPPSRTFGPVVVGELVVDTVVSWLDDEVCVAATSSLSLLAQLVAVAAKVRKQQASASCRRFLRRTAVR